MQQVVRRQRSRPSASALAAAGPVVSALSVQAGAGFGATLLPLVGPIGVVGLRQLFAALALSPSLVRSIRGLGWHALRPALMLGVVLVVMNVTIYASIERIGLGLAVTLEFLGPLALALASSRRLIDLISGIAAGLGVVLLTGTVGDVDPVGVLLALAAAAAWVGYIVLSSRVGGRIRGSGGTAIASAVASLITLPLLVVVMIGLPADQLPLVLGVGLAVGVLSSAFPYSLDLAVLRLIPRELFSVLQSVHPGAAALSGLLILGETLTLWQTTGLVLISVANAAAVWAASRRNAALRRAAPGTSSEPL